MKFEIEIPPAYFSNVINRLNLPIDWRNWRKSPYWEIFVAGNNYGVNKVEVYAKSKINMGQEPEKLFGIYEK